MTEKKKMGRPSKGERRSVALTIPEEVWSTIDVYLFSCKVPMADYLRELVIKDVESFDAITGGVLHEYILREASKRKG
ncbi:hypothetical protein D3C85_1732900 [compost metagenome]